MTAGVDEFNRTEGSFSSRVLKVYGRTDRESGARPSVAELVTSVVCSYCLTHESMKTCVHCELVTISFSGDCYPLW